MSVFEILVDELLGWRIFLFLSLFLLLLAGTVSFVLPWRDPYRGWEIRFAVIANVINVLIQVGWFWFLRTWTFEKSERLVTWPPELSLKGLSIYLWFAVLIGLAIAAISLGRKRKQLQKRPRRFALISIGIAILISLITIRVPFAAQAVLDRN